MTDTQPETTEDEWVCGESYDHTLQLLSEDDDGNQNFMCTECGAEIWDENEEGEAD